jgi:LCP family protein required for cell wall assembly
MVDDVSRNGRQTPDGGHSRAVPLPWLATLLSVVVPGLGQVYERRYVRAFVWFSPVLLLSFLGFRAVELSVTDLVGAALDPSVLWGIFWVNVVGVVWRLGAAIDAYRLANGGVTGPIAFAVGWALVALVIALPHLIVGRYTFDAVTLVSAVFVDDSPQVLDPVIPIGTDADIVPDPLTPMRADAGRVSDALTSVGTAADTVPSPVDTSSAPERDRPFNEDLWAPEVVAARMQIIRDRIRETEPPFLPFVERVGERRISILIAGGDAGPGRGGLRTDSMIVASLHMGTGKAALFGFPRNMGSIPLPRRFQNAFIKLEKRVAPTAVGDAAPVFRSCRCFPEQLNALYPFTRKWTRTYPDARDPGMAALRDVLADMMGTRIDYYVLVDMATFVDLVDAIGGIDVDVRQPLQAEVSPPREGDPWAKVDVDVGWNHLDGSQALAYARARKGSSDYARMERQRCMLRGVAARADAVTILRSFPAIVDAISNSMVTDVPRSFAAEFIGAASGLDFDDIQTVGFTHAYWEEERDHLGHPIPDIGRIRSKVRRVFAGLDEAEVVAEGDAECDA